MFLLNQPVEIIFFLCKTNGSCLNVQYWVVVGNLSQDLGGRSIACCECLLRPDKFDRDSWKTFKSSLSDRRIKWPFLDETKHFCVALWKVSNFDRILHLCPILDPRGQRETSLRAWHTSGRAGKVQHVFIKVKVSRESNNFSNLPHLLI